MEACLSNCIGLCQSLCLAREIYVDPKDQSLYIDAVLHINPFLPVGFNWLSDARKVRCDLWDGESGGVVLSEQFPYCSELSIVPTFLHWLHQRLDALNNEDFHVYIGQGAAAMIDAQAKGVFFGP